MSPSAGRLTQKTWRDPETGESRHRYVVTANQIDLQEWSGGDSPPAALPNTVPGRRRHRGYSSLPTSQKRHRQLVSDHDRESQLQNRQAVDRRRALAANGPLGCQHSETGGCDARRSARLQIRKELVGRQPGWVLPGSACDRRREQRAACPHLTTINCICAPLSGGGTMARPKRCPLGIRSRRLVELSADSPR